MYVFSPGQRAKALPACVPGCFQQLKLCYVGKGRRICVTECPHLPPIAHRTLFTDAFPGNPWKAHRGVLSPDPWKLCDGFTWIAQRGDMQRLPSTSSSSWRSAGVSRHESLPPVPICSWSLNAAWVYVSLWGLLNSAGEFSLCL